MANQSKQAKGGAARAAALTAEERKEIAIHAAEARWGASNSLLPKETHTGFIKVGDELIQCSVLDNGMRVFSTRAIARTMGSKGKGGRVREAHEAGAQMLPTFLSSSSMKPFIVSNGLMVPLVSPVQYRPKHGGRTAFGYEAKLLPKVCGVILDADKAGAVKSKGMAEKAEVLIRAFATVGVIALIDEATGYQEERAKDELARILEAYVQEEFRPWTRMFPEEFFRQIYRIHGWPYKPGNAKRTPLIGHMINKYIYKQLPPGVFEELRELNPVTEGGYRRKKHFQYLTSDTGNDHLDRQIMAVLTLMRISDTKEELEHNFAKAFGKTPVPLQQRLPLVIDMRPESDDPRIPKLGML